MYPVIGRQDSVVIPKTEAVPQDSAIYHVPLLHPQLPDQAVGAGTSVGGILKVASAMAKFQKNAHKERWTNIKKQIQERVEMEAEHADEVDLEELQDFHLDKAIWEGDLLEDEEFIASMGALSDSDDSGSELGESDSDSEGGDHEDNLGRRSVASVASVESMFAGAVTGKAPSRDSPRGHHQHHHKHHHHGHHGKKAAPQPANDTGPKQEHRKLL